MKVFICLIALLVLFLNGCSSPGGASNSAAVNNSVTTVNKNSTSSLSNKPSASTDSSSGAGAVIERFVSAAEKGDIDEMNNLCSKECSPKAKTLNTNYSKMVKDLKSKGGSLFALHEKSKGEGKAHVEFNYGVNKDGVTTGQSTGCTAFELINEDGGWKINNPSDCE